MLCFSQNLVEPISRRFRLGRIAARELTRMQSTKRNRRMLARSRQNDGSAFSGEGRSCLLAEEEEHEQEQSNAFADTWPCPPTTTSAVCPTRLGISSVWPASQKRLRSTNSPLLASNSFYSTQCNRFGLTLSVLLSNQYYYVTVTPSHDAYQKYTEI